MSRCTCLALLSALVVDVVAASWSAAADDEPLVVQRIADGVSAKKGNPGHVHPVVCVATDGTVVVAHFAEAAKRIFVLRSTDGGRTFEEADEVPEVGTGHPYPGALTALTDGRIVLMWNSWLAWPDVDRGRRPAYAVSGDAGRTWSAPKMLPLEYHRNTWIRHRLLERSPHDWILPMSDRVISYAPQTEKITEPFPALTAYEGPIVRTRAGTLLHGSGHRSTDDGRTWSKAPVFPDVAGYRSDLLALDDGAIVAAVAKDNKTFWLNASYDDGQSWKLARRWVIYDPGHEIGNACPQLAQLDARHLGIVFWDHNREQSGGPGVYFARLTLGELKRRTSE